MEITSEQLKKVCGEKDAREIYEEVKSGGDFRGFTSQFIYNEDDRVVRNLFWVLTKASDKELSQIQEMLNELTDLAMQTENSSVRRLCLNIVERQKMEEKNLRTDFLDFCFEHFLDVEEFSGIQAVCLKLAFHMCKFYPELMEELMRTLEAMEIDYYKPAVKSLRNRILSGRLS